MDEDDLVFLAEDGIEEVEEAIWGHWNILIVDDEPEVHRVTKLALDGFRFAEKELNFISAYSGAEAREILSATEDIAVILLDVVMETDHAGLDVARWVREDLKNTFSRIVLRTGQPGQAPEREVISAYDINDYKEKTELTSRKLYTLMFSSLRSYRDICVIDSNKRGLEKIIDASASIFEHQSLERFTAGALQQLSALFHLNHGAVYGKKDGLAATSGRGKFKIVAGTGKYSDAIGKNLDEVLPTATVDLLQQYMEKGDSGFEGDAYISAYKTRTGVENLLFLSGMDRNQQVDRHLIEIFGSNIGIAFDNLHLMEAVETTQREVVYRLGEAVETRSEETGNHVKRVAEICCLLAHAYGMDTQDAEVIRHASPLHDVGKIGIPDAILNKPGKLDEEEWEVMKTHTEIGYRMLADSDQTILRVGAEIAAEHHEKWDGSGYPNGKKGESISLFARIAAVADVFDALSSRRCYKSPWTEEQVLDYFEEQKGQHFDPRLVELLVDKLEDIRQIQALYPD